MALTLGTRLGVYEITAQIGEDGMGQVYRATDTKLKRQVAIKILPPKLAADHDRLARSQREAEVLASLNHPNIAAIYGLEESGGTTALVMELVEGEDSCSNVAPPHPCLPAPPGIRRWVTPPGVLVDPRRRRVPHQAINRAYADQVAGLTTTWVNGACVEPSPDRLGTLSGTGPCRQGDRRRRRGVEGDHQRLATRLEPPPDPPRRSEATQLPRAVVVAVRVRTDDTNMEGRMTSARVTHTVRLAAVAAVALIASAATVRTQDARAPRNAAEYDAMFQEINNWRRWGADDELGTMNLVTPAKVREAAALVRRGITVSLSHNPMTEVTPDNPAGSFKHTMGASRRTDTYEFTYHGYGVSHVDSLCHFLWNDRLYNDIAPSSSTAQGCGKLGIQNLKRGIVTRGILLDFPRLKGVPYLEPGTPLYVEDIEAWERRAKVKVSSGDAIFVRTGRWARRGALGPWQVGTSSAGLHASVLPWIKARGVALVGSDAATDVMPSRVDGVTQPVHTMLLAGFGTNVFDNMDLEALAEAAGRENRWEFMLTAGPIPVDGGTGSPLNPIAAF